MFHALFQPCAWAGDWRNDLFVRMYFKAKKLRIAVVDDDFNPAHDRIAKGFGTGKVGEGEFRFRVT